MSLFWYLASLLLSSSLVSHSFAFRNSIQQCGGVIRKSEEFFIRTVLLNAKTTRIRKEAQRKPLRLFALRSAFVALKKNLSIRLLRTSNDSTNFDDKNYGTYKSAQQKHLVAGSLFYNDLSSPCYFSIR